MALCRFQWKLTSGGIPRNAKLARHGSAQRLVRQVFEFGHAQIGDGDGVGDGAESSCCELGLNDMAGVTA
jgi:hypothetical protein